MRSICLILAPTFVIIITATALNRVLSLSGDSAYVQLPSDIFNHLDETTIEGWMKWERFGFFSQPFGFGSLAEQWNVVAVNNTKNTNGLQFSVYDQKRLHLIP